MLLPRIFSSFKILKSSLCAGVVAQWKSTCPTSARDQVQSLVLQKPNKAHCNIAGYVYLQLNIFQGVYFSCISYLSSSKMFYMQCYFLTHISDLREILSWHEFQCLFFLHWRDSEFLQHHLIAVSRSIPHMNSLMDTESGLPAEGLATFSTLIRFLSSMDSQM